MPWPLHLQEKYPAPGWLNGDESFLLLGGLWTEVKANNAPESNDGRVIGGTIPTTFFILSPNVQYILIDINTIFFLISPRPGTGFFFFDILFFLKEEGFTYDVIPPFLFCCPSGWAGQYIVEQSH